MKLNTFILKSTLALCAFVTVKAKAINDNTNDITTVEKDIPSFRPPPVKECLISQTTETMINQHYSECQKKDGLFYKKFNPYPKCNYDYVCFFPSYDDRVYPVNCFSLDGANYCSSDISNIKYCQFGCKAYDFMKCVKYAMETFSDFHYDAIYYPFVTKPVSVPTATPDIKN